MKNRLSFLIALGLSFLLTSFLTAQEFGVASVYQDKFHGKVTAYGRTYNKNELVAAHKKHLPGTWLKVTRLDNKKSVTVEVIDRGPFVRGRIVDLSSRAAKVLDMLEDGVANVKVEVVQRGKPSLGEATPAPGQETPKPAIPQNFDDAAGDRIDTGTPENTKPTPPDAKPPTTTEPPPPPAEKKELTPKGESTTAKPKAPATSKEMPTEVLIGKGFSFFDTYKLHLEKAAKSDFGVQVAYLTNFEGLLKQVANLQAKWYDNIMVYKDKGENGALGYKVILGSFDAEDKAQAYQKSLAGKGVKGFVAIAGENYQQDDLYRIQLKKPAKMDFGVQVASLTSEEGVMKQVSDLQAKWFDNTLLSVEPAQGGSPVYKIILGPFESEDKATAYKSTLSKKHRIKGFVVPLK